VEAGVSGVVINSKNVFLSKLLGYIRGKICSLSGWILGFKRTAAPHYWFEQNQNNHSFWCCQPNLFEKCSHGF